TTPRGVVTAGGSAHADEKGVSRVQHPCRSARRIRARRARFAICRPLSQRMRPAGARSSGHRTSRRKRGGADLVVMATHGRTGIRRAVLGSVAGAVLTPGSVPVLL